MPVFHDSALIGAAGASGTGAGGYQISRSLRFNSADSAYLSRTPASSGNRKTWTWSGWVKRSALGGTQVFFGSWTDSSNTMGLMFNTSNQLFWDSYSSGSLQGSQTTSAVFRDTSAWYHIVWAVDTTDATAANRSRIYVNGTEVAYAGATNPSQNADLMVNRAASHTIGNTSASAGNYFSGYLADIHFIDGQALTPSSFAETDATTGQWVPKAFSGGSYGTNGFRLTFSDNSGTTATTLGKDAAGSNNFTPTNFSVSSGAGNDSLVDTPTSYGTDTGAGGEVRGNYATLNPLVNFNSSTLTNGNLDVTCASVSGQWRTQKGGWGFYGGKFYFEATLNAGGSAGNSGVGIGRITLPHSANAYPGQSAGSYAYTSDGGKIDSGSATYPWATWTVNDVIGVATDLTAGTVAFYKNGTLQGSMTGLDTTLTYEVLVGSASSTASQYSLNFGQRPFAYTAPSGFKALCDQNLPAPTIAKPSTVMDVVLYTGNSTDNRAITGLGFSPDLVWFGPRSQSGQDKVICDSVRGVQKAFFSNQTYVEANPALYGSVGSFDSAGFTIKKGTDATFGFHQVNLNSSTYAAWCWDAGTTTSSNGSGSITSQVRANASAGFSVVTWTGNGVAGATVGHGLGTNVALYFCKNRSTASNWVVIGHALNSALGGPKYLQLNTTAAAGVASQGPGNSSTIELYNDSTNNTNGDTYVAYCFAPVAGYSAFGSYTGNGSADGPFVYTGFRPRWVMLKQSSGSGTGWQIHDTSRNTYNVMNNRLQPNNSDAESTYTTSDFLSNGFKLRDSDPSWNSNGATYIYAAFAENPFQYARAR